MLPFFALILSLFPTGTPASNPFCKSPGYIVRAPASAPDRDLGRLLEAHERATAPPEKLLTASPLRSGGHSELGYRYLARAFGYSGGFDKEGAVEEWLAEQAVKDRSYGGIFAVWKRWVEEPRFPLAAEEGQKALELRSFFGGDRVAAVQFSECLARAIAESRCESFAQTRIVGEARVYFGRPGGRAPCAIHHNGGRLSGNPPSEVKIGRESTRKLCSIDGSGCATENISEKWEWKNGESSATAQAR